MDKHIKYMALALKEAEKSLKTNDVPIGAMAVYDGKIIARAHNEKEKRNDATAHAELLCLNKAAKKLRTWRLNNVDIYTTLEPCAMCAGAMVLARIRTLVFAVSDPKAGAAGSVMNIVNNKKLNHRVKVVNLMKCKNNPELISLANRCGKIIKDFFRGLRS